MTARLVLAGHSHVHALGVPGRPRDQPPALVPLRYPTADLACITGVRNAAYWEAFVVAAERRVPAVIWTGNQHYSQFLFTPAPAFDLVLSSAPNLPIDRDAQIVAEEMIRAFYAASLAPLPALLARLNAASPWPAIVIGTPPPKGDPERLCAMLAQEPVLTAAAARFGLPIAPASLTPVAVMVKLWRLGQAMLAEIAAAAGAVFVPVPDRLIVGAGVLADDHWAADATHANRDYGAQMLAEVIRAAEALGRRCAA